MTQSTLAARFQSIHLSIDTMIRCGLSTLTMNDPAAIDKILAQIDGTIDFYRGERSKLDAALASLEEMAGRLRRAQGDGPQSSTMIGSHPPTLDQASLTSESARSVEKPSYQYCEQCETFLKPGFSHACDQDHSHMDGNTFEKEQLDIVHGEGGWVRIDPPYHPKPKLRRPGEWTSDPPSESPQIANPQNVHQATPHAHLFREGSKTHRIFVITEKLLQQNRQIHIDDIMKNIPEKFFDEVKSDKRTNLSNVLSQLKSKGLLVSDHRGNWSLPTRRIAE